MKKKLLLFLAITFCSLSFAQVIQLGSGTATNSVTTASPVNVYYRRQVCQFVYTASEINAAGGYGPNTLSQLGFYVTSNPATSIPGYTIKIKHTTKTNVSSSLGTSGWTIVKNAFNYTPLSGGYDMINFDAPFFWDGIQNIGVEICWTATQPTWNSSGQCRIYNTNRGYRYRRDDDNGSICGVTPNTRNNNKPQVQLIFKTTSIWNGSVNTDWFNASNWDAGIPETNMDALIPSSASIMPTISNTGAVCKNLTIDAGASLTLLGSNNIDIYKDWTNNGVFVANTGNVTFKGTSINNIYATLNQKMHDLTIDNINGASIMSGSINLHGNLNIGVVSGSFNTNNSLTIISDANGTGRIAELSTKCLYTLDMSDSWGDSWNGGYITVLVNGTSIGTYYAKGSNSTDHFFVATGSTIQLNYTSGSYENENSYILYDGFGTPIFNDGPNPNTGTNVFNTTATCSFSNPITGNITMQRYIDAGATNWRFLTSAISGSTLADMNDNFVTSGFTGSDYPNWPSASAPWSSIKFYDETQPGDRNVGFTDPTNITNSLPTGTGIWVWSGDTITGTQPFTIDITGPPNTGDISLPLSYTNSGSSTGDGWNMVGNPYPSTLDWDSPNIIKNGINNAIYIWNPDLQQYASYISGIGTNGGSNKIASSQAFWVQTISPSPSVIVTESSKTNADVSFTKQGSSTDPFKIITQNSNGKDEMIINFEDNATISYDADFDALKLVSTNSNVPYISSVMNNLDYSINSIQNQEIYIPIKILTSTEAIHSLKFENISSLTNSSCVSIEDLFTGNLYDLTTIDSFNVFIYDTTTVARFLLHIGAPTNITLKDISCNGNTDASIFYSKNNISPFNVTWKDNLGNIIAVNTNVISSDSLFNLAAGTYYVESTNQTCENSVDTVIIDEPLLINSTFSSIDTIYLSNGGSISFNNQSINATNYLWNFGDGDSSIISSPTHVYSQVGNYVVNLTASQSSSCFDNYSKIITVLGNLTNVNTLTSNNNINLWISDNVLNINFNNNQFEKIELYTVLGQNIYTSTNFLSSELFLFDVNRFNGTMLLVTLFKNGTPQTIKVPVIR